MHELKDLEAAQKYIATHGHDKHDKNKGLLPVEDPRIIDLIREDIVDPKAAKMASKLAVLIDYRNIAFTDTDAIASELQMAKSNLARRLEYLDTEGLVHTILSNGSTSPKRTLVFNPSLYWKGSYQLKNMVEEKILIRCYSWRDLSKLDIGGME